MPDVLYKHCCSRSACQCILVESLDSHSNFHMTTVQAIGSRSQILLNIRQMGAFLKTHQRMDMQRRLKFSKEAQRHSALQFQLAGSKNSREF
jgi:hypothetical protein